MTWDGIEMRRSADSLRFNNENGTWKDVSSHVMERIGDTLTNTFTAARNLWGSKLSNLKKKHYMRMANEAEVRAAEQKRLSEEAWRNVVWPRARDCHLRYKRKDGCNS